jgi:hypothetical protein
VLDCLVAGQQKMLGDSVFQRGFVGVDADIGLAVHTLFLTHSRQFFHI